MLPDRVSNPGPLTFESGALPIALRGPAKQSAGVYEDKVCMVKICVEFMNHQNRFHPLKY